MRHLTVYQQDMTPAAWQSAQLTSGLGRLPDTVEPRLHLAVNGDRSLTFRYPLTGRGYGLLQKMRLVCAEGQLYRITQIKKSDKVAGRDVQVTALHIMYDLRRNELENIETSETTPGGITQKAALEQVLAGTPFTAGTVDDNETLDYLDVLQKSSFWAIKEQVLALWGGELEPDNWTINIRTQIGQDKRYPIRGGRNLAGIECTESIEDTITRLHVSGYGGATFEDINGGRDYIDSPNIDHYPMPLEGRVEFTDDDLPEDLMRLALEHLPTVDVPQVEYDIDLLALRNSVQYALYKPLETFNLGDTAVIHHDFFDVDIIARTMELERDPVLEENVRVVLGNYKKDLYTALSGASKAAAMIGRVTTLGGGLRGERVEGAIDLMRARLRASGSYQNAQVIENQGMLLENTNPDSPDYGAIYHGPGTMALANSRAADGSWNWRIGITPNGIAGEVIQLEAEDGIKISVIEAIIRGAKDELANHLITQPTPPEDPAMDLIWADTSVEPPVMKRWDGEGWQIISDTESIYELLSIQDARIGVINTQIDMRVTKTDYDQDMDNKANKTAVEELSAQLSLEADAIRAQVTQAKTIADGAKTEVETIGTYLTLDPVTGLMLRQPQSQNGINIGNGAVAIVDGNGKQVAVMAEGRSLLPVLDVSNQFKMGRFVTSILPDGGIIEQWI